MRPYTDTWAKSAADKLRNDLQSEISDRVTASGILIKSSFFHPTYNLLYKHGDPENFNVLKDLVRREMQDVAPLAQATLQASPETPAVTDRLSKAMQRLVDMQDPTRNAAQSEPGDVLDRYFQSPQCQDISINPMDWWRQHEVRFPALAILARKYLSLPATSVASERMFSCAGNYVTDTRNRLTDDCVSDLVFCNNALKTLERVKK